MVIMATNSTVCLLPKWGNIWQILKGQLYTDVYFFSPSSFYTKTFQLHQIKHTTIQHINSSAESENHRTFEPEEAPDLLSVQQFSTLAAHTGELKKKNNTAWAHPKPTEPELLGVEPHRYFFVSHRASQVVLEVKNLPANAGDIRHTGSIPASERSPGEWDGYPLQYSCLENPMDRGVWWATVHGVAKSQTWLKRLSTCTHKRF